MTYRYALLDPRPGADNEPVFASGPLLGIEVTVPALAARCELGNIDPQHSGGDPTRAAIQEALEVELPPPGAVLATVRPDPDALGAMAVLEIRARGGGVSDEVRERVLEIARVDAWRRGPWPGPRELPRPEDPVELEPLTGIGAVVADPGLPLEERVVRMGTWLETGTCPGLAEAEEAVAWEMREALEATSIELAPSGMVAVVRSTHRTGVSLGYRLAPVVVAENPSFVFQGGEPHRKLTIAQYEPGWVDLQEVVAELSAREPGWGGSPTICGSPQGTGCEIPLGDVVEAVEAHLLRRSPGTG
jgi:hypothetical protein